VYALWNRRCWFPSQIALSPRSSSYLWASPVDLASSYLSVRIYHPMRILRFVSLFCRSWSGKTCFAESRRVIFLYRQVLPHRGVRHIEKPIYFWGVKTYSEKKAPAALISRSRRSASEEKGGSNQNWSSGWSGCAEKVKAGRRPIEGEANRKLRKVQ
jgi:hypothetical protein